MKIKSRRPSQGEIRTRTKFAWLPVRTTYPNQNTVIWLEKYKTEEVYYVSPYGAVGDWFITKIYQK